MSAEAGVSSQLKKGSGPRIGGVLERIRPSFAWYLLGYNVLVILGGAFVRATVSGDGCGNHWPDCNGGVLPEFGHAKKLIEYSHRASTGILLPMVLLLIAWAFRAFPKGHRVRKGAVGVLAFTLVEAFIGAVLVKQHWVAFDASVERAIMMPLHLVNAFGLLGALTLTAWWASGGAPLRLRGQGAMGWAVFLALAAATALGITGAITALGDTLFPASSLAEGLRQDFAPEAHFLQAVRIYHPLVAMSAGLYMALVAGLCMKLRPAEPVQRFAQATLLIFTAQMGVGMLNLGLLAPVWMQLIHLLLADLFWIALVLMAATALAEGVPHVELTPADAELAAEAKQKAGWREYLALTKPRVISLLLLTTLAAMPIAAGRGGRHSVGFLLYVAVGLGLYMAAGAANAINMVLERDLDLRMGRTAKRPTVTETISPRAALQFALVLMVGSFGLLWYAANLLTAMLALAGLAFYVVVYTLLLKRRTWANIVIGGAAGAFPPLVGWAAVTGDLSPLAWCLFGIIFLWTPVHFWALALLIKEDYEKAGVPMLPVVRGEKATVAQIGFYALLTAAVSAAPLLLHGPDGNRGGGWFYLVSAVALNGVLLQQSFKLYRHPEPAALRGRARVLFHYSMLYLALLFLAMAVDRANWS
jgi:protoheme IX farnesyltransferase